MRVDLRGVSDEALEEERAARRARRAEQDLNQPGLESRQRALEALGWRFPHAASEVWSDHPDRPNDAFDPNAHEAHLGVDIHKSAKKREQLLEQCEAFEREQEARPPELRSRALPLAHPLHPAHEETQC